MDMNAKGFFEMMPTDEELVSPEKLLTIIEKKSSEIKSIRFQLPDTDTDSDDFGRFRVQWNPCYPGLRRRSLRLRGPAPRGPPG